MPPSLNGHYYHLACPLCWQDVDRSQTDSFRLLPLNPEKISRFYEKPIFEEQWYSLVKVGGRTITHLADYPDEPGLYRLWALHTRCISLVNHLPPSKLYQLLDLVEPTFLSRKCGGHMAGEGFSRNNANWHGSFSTYAYKAIIIQGKYVSSRRYEVAGYTYDCYYLSFWN